MDKIFSVGVIGVGTMGYPVVKHLLNSGYKVTISKHSDNLESRQRLNELKELGANVKDSVDKVASESNLIISLLPSEKEISDVYLSEEFRNNVLDKTVIVEMSSCNPDVLFEVEDYYSSKSIHIIDAPVSGGLKKAVTGTLTVLASGEEDVLNSIKSVIEVFAETIFYVGKLGSGKTLKSINQIMIGINLVGVVESFILAKEYDLDLDIVYDVIMKSSGSSYAFEKYFNRLRSGDFNDGFKTKLMLKDIGTAISMAQEIKLPMTNTAYNLFRQNKSNNELDFSSVLHLYRMKAEGTFRF